MNNIRNREREIDILNHITKNNQGPFSDQQLTTIYELIFEEHRILQKGIKK
jgi:chorismate mutase